MTPKEFGSLFSQLEILSGFPAGERAQKTYYNTLKHLDADRFGMLVEAALTTLEFMPRPVWFIENSNAMTRSERQLYTPALPAASIEELTAGCPEHVKRYMAWHQERGTQLAGELLQARKMGEDATEIVDAIDEHWGLSSDIATPSELAKSRECREMMEFFKAQVEEEGCTFEYQFS